MLVKVNGTIPDDVAIQCPMVGFKLRSASNCILCRYYDGLGLMAHNPNVKLHWAKQFTIRCMHPIERRVMITNGD